MRKLLFIAFITLFLNESAQCQSCLPDGIMFGSQEEIDNFAINYSGCTSIEGYVDISGPDITNLNGLSGLTYVGGGFSIRENPLLTSLDGLESLTSCAALNVEFNPVLTSISGLQNLTSTQFGLGVRYNDALTNLNGLQGLTSVGGGLGVGYNPVLTDISALHNLQSIGGGLFISTNDLLPSLNGLQNITVLPGSFLLENNPMLPNLDSLKHLVSIGGDASIRVNQSLASLSGLDHLTTVGGEFRFEYNDALSDMQGLDQLKQVGGSLVLNRNQGLITLNGLDSLTTVGGDLYLELNTALTTMAGLGKLSSIGGKFYIQSNVSLAEIGNFPKLTTIGGDLEIQAAFPLTSFNGLENLKTIGGNFFMSQMQSLKNLDGLSNLSTLGGSLSIAGGDSLTSIAGLSSLTKVNGFLFIDFNPILTQLNGLDNLTAITGNVLIEYNPELADISALHNLKTIGGYLNIQNTKLTSLDALENLDYIGGEVFIVWNPLLSDCSIFSVCNHLLLEPDSVYFGANAPGCDTPDQVEAQCGGIPVLVSVQTDTNGDCEPDANGWPATGVQVRLSGASQMTLRSGDSGGLVHFFYLDTGLFTLHLVQFPSDNWAVCQDDIQLNPDTLTQDTLRATILLSPLNQCPELSVTLGLPSFFRSCLVNSTVQVAVENTGTVVAQGVRTAVVLPPALELVTAIPPPAAQNSDTLFFDLGELPPFGLSKLELTVRTVCDTFLIGQTLCLEAFASLDNPCPNTLPDHSEIKLSAECIDGDSVRFTLKNIGDAPTQGGHEYKIIRNEVSQSPVSFSLAAQQSLAVSVPADGATYRMEATKLDDGTLTATALENCGGLTPGYITAFWLDKGPLEYDFDCRQVNGSFDPNLKTAVPTGAGGNHSIVANRPLEYTIDFQNTGTDTAFRVRLRDELPPELDANTFRPGAASHPCSWEIQGERTLEVLFSPIALPDSNANPAASHGYFSFTIDQKPDLPEGTVFNNTASIIFDFNPPIPTNYVWHTIGQFTVRVDEAQSYANLWRVLGNPVADVARFRTEQYTAGEKQFELFDVAGRRLRSVQFSGQEFDFQRDGLPDGLYFFRISDAQGRVFAGKIIAGR